MNVVRPFEYLMKVVQPALVLSAQEVDGKAFFDRIGGGPADVLNAISQLRDNDSAQAAGVNWLILASSFRNDRSNPECRLALLKLLNLRCDVSERGLRYIFDVWLDSLITLATYAIRNPQHKLMVLPEIGNPQFDRVRKLIVSDNELIEALESVDANDRLRAYIFMRMNPSKAKLYLSELCTACGKECPSSYLKTMAAKAIDSA